MVKRILFVDDQPNVLDGLRRMLRGMRHEWDMVFSNGGEEAMELLKQSAFDVVVSDMRMPGIDGAMLLDHVMHEYPQTVRIILSGQSEQETILRSIGPAHQFLTKPCDAEMLKSTVARACALRDELANDALKQLISQVTTLPSAPKTYNLLVAELNSADTSMERIANLISQDVAMTAKLLHLVNSSFFGLPQRVESPAHAATLLGLELVQTLVLSAGIFSQFDDDKIEGFSIDSLMAHSLAVSTRAQQIAANYAPDDSILIENALMAGMVHDVGKLVLATNLPKQYREMISAATSGESPLVRAERETLGATHADVGAYLLGLWGLPNAIVEAVAFHHEPSRCPDPSFSPLTAVHLANVFENEQRLENETDTKLEIDSAYVQRLQIADRLPEWRHCGEATLNEGA